MIYSLWLNNECIVSGLTFYEIQRFLNNAENQCDYDESDAYEIREDN